MPTPVYPDYYNLYLPFKIALAAFRQHIPFALYIKPDNQNPNAIQSQEALAIDIIVSKDDSLPVSNRTFEIGNWGKPTSERIILRDTLDYQAKLDLISSETINDTPASCNIYGKSTSRHTHKQQVEEIISLLKSQPGSRKIVLSKTICGEIATDDYYSFWIKVAATYFAQHTNTFRYLYYTPQTGAWLGASPEILLSVNKKRGTSYTVALAGTRIGDPHTVWDTKNTDEQMQVSQFITDVLKDFGYSVLKDSIPDVKFGNLVHKCDRFEFHMNPDDRYKLIDRLSPTPALSGFPRSQAMSVITRLEEHERLCYGGFVALNEECYYQAYVNLRCVHFDKKDYCIYAGGGITALSDPDAEWEETEKKAASLLKCITNQCH